MEPSRLTVFGAGYLGIVQAACLAEAGFEVLGIDTDASRVAKLRGGESGIYEPGLDELLARQVAAGRLDFTTDYAHAARFGDVHFICVGTPQGPDGAADLSQVDGCLDALVPLLRRDCLVVGRSTVPVGTAARIAKRLDGTAELAWNPEFLREGHAVADTTRPDRIVVGVTSGRAEATLRHVYRDQLRDGVPFLVTDLATTELVKLAANAFGATKISFVNAMAELCEASGANAGLLAEALGADPRIGSQWLRPGLGFGGGCLPKDIRSLSHCADQAGVPDLVRLLRDVDAINSRRRERMVGLAAELAGPLPAARLAVLGLAFKPGTDDIRDSPALDVAGRLHASGASVVAYDPVATERARAVLPGLTYTATLAEAVTDADAVLVLTEWPEFAAADPGSLGHLVARRNVADGRGVLDPARWQAAGWTYRSLGVDIPDNRRIPSALDRTGPRPAAS